MFMTTVEKTITYALGECDPGSAQDGRTSSKMMVYFHLERKKTLTKSRLLQTYSFLPTPLWRNCSRRWGLAHSLTDTPSFHYKARICSCKHWKQFITRCYLHHWWYFWWGIDKMSKDLCLQRNLREDILKDCRWLKKSSPLRTDSFPSADVSHSQWRNSKGSQASVVGPSTHSISLISLLAL